MQAINHALTGAVIGLTVQKPLLAVPAAFLSHFVCDVIPHYGSSKTEPDLLVSNWFRYQLLIDASLCIGLVLLLRILLPNNWFIPSLCAFVATTPDLAWLPKYIRANIGRVIEPQPNVIVRFTGWIQWFERPIGAVVELAWTTAMITLLLALI